MNPVKFAIFAALIVAGLAGASQGSVITQTMSYGPSDTPFSDPLTFNTFNTSAGTLQSVKLILTEGGTVTSSVWNFSPTPSTYSNVTTTGNVSISGPDSTTLTAGFTTLPASGTITTTATPTVVGTMSGSASASATAGSLLAYESTGAGTFLINAVSSITTTGTSNTGLVGFFGSGHLNGTVEVDYTYTPSTSSPVPEPSSLGLIAVGLGGLLTARRFRRR